MSLLFHQEPLSGVIHCVIHCGCDTVWVGVGWGGYSLMATPIWFSICYISVHSLPDFDLI